MYQELEQILDENLQSLQQNIIIPIEYSKLLISDYVSEIFIQDTKNQIYGKALNGNSTLQFINGNHYEGEVSKGMLNGKGQYKWKNGVKYLGDFMYNQISGQGQYIWPDNSQYSGQIQNGLRNGFGTFIASDGKTKYTGEWKNGQRTGNGKIEFSSGAVYEGQFLNGFKHGKGVMKYISGNYYEGQFINDKKEGFGTMHWLDFNEKYSGEWKNNLQHGYGYHIWLEPKGENKVLRNRYEGQWEEGQRQGLGVFYYANGSKYQGEWHVNKKEGFSIFTEDTGKTVQGYFKSDKLVKKLQVVNRFEQYKSTNELKQNADSPGHKISSKLTIKASSVIKLPESIRVIKKPPPVQSPNTQNEEKKNAKKPMEDIQENPLIEILDFSDLNINFIQQNTIEQIYTILIRFNTLLKSTYKHYCNKYDISENESSFSMDLSCYWRFLKDIRIFGGQLTLAFLNRLFYQGNRNDFSLHCTLEDLRCEFNILKKCDRHFTNEEKQNIHLINILENDIQSSFLEPKDIHNDDQIVMFRHFIDLLIRTAYIKSAKGDDTAKTLENIIQKYIQPYFDNKKKIKSQSTKINVGEYEVQVGIVYQKMTKNTKQVMREIFSLQKQINKQNYYYKDETILLKNIIKLLKNASLLENENEIDLVYSFVESGFEQNETIYYIENLQKEREREKEKEKENIKQQNSKKQRQRKKTPDYNRIKVQKTRLILNNEFIFYEFAQLIIIVLLKYIKDPNNIEDAEKKMLPYLNKIIKQNQIQAKLKKQLSIKWPESIKDNLKKLLIQDRIRIAEQQEKKKRKEEEKKKEQREVACMQLEDINIPSEAEEESEEGGIY